MDYTSGVFFLNAAELWVDILNKDDGVEAYFIAEKGAFDVFILLGPTPDAAVKQYASLTGVAPLPQVSAELQRNTSQENRHPNALAMF